MARQDPRNQSRYWHFPAMAGIDLLQADFTTHNYAPHVHDSLVMAVTEVGGSEFKSRGRTGHAEPNTLLVFNPGEPHSGRMGGSERWRYRSIYIAEAALKPLLEMLGTDQARHFTTNTIADPGLVKSALTLLRAMDGPNDPLLQQELLVGTLGDLFNRHGQLRASGTKAKPGLDLLQPTLRLMRECYEQPLQLNELAATAKLTPFQLISAFKQSIGLTPHTYLNQLRLRAALKLLKSGRSPAEVALASGFYDQSALNHHFKTTFGMTPMQFVRAH